MAHLKGTLLACLGAALVALSAAGLKTEKRGACTAPEAVADNAGAVRPLLIF
ncbi:hypothetical protein [Hyphococcus sp.]|uniref:hypothetical protein n=1 Tax=Hyphococcus sp. TaxID=2038636 RepID=UPI0035C6EC74